MVPAVVEALDARKLALADGRLCVIDQHGVVLWLCLIESLVVDYVVAHLLLCVEPGAVDVPVTKVVVKVDGLPDGVERHYEFDLAVFLGPQAGSPSKSHPLEVVPIAPSCIEGVLASLRNDVWERPVFLWVLLSLKVYISGIIVGAEVQVALIISHPQDVFRIPLPELELSPADAAAARIVEQNFPHSDSVIADEAVVDCFVVGASRVAGGLGPSIVLLPRSPCWLRVGVTIEW